jgi:hypothetical protein
MPLFGEHTQFEEFDWQQQGEYMAADNLRLLLSMDGQV